MESRLARCSNGVEPGTTWERHETQFAFCKRVGTRGVARALIYESFSVGAVVSFMRETSRYAVQASLIGGVAHLETQNLEFLES